MSKTVLPFVQGASAGAGIAAAVSAVLAKIAPSVSLNVITKAADAPTGGVFVGQGISAEQLGSFSFNTAITAPAVALAADYPTLKNIAVVRAVASDPECVAIRYRDRVDVLSASGIDTAKETEFLKQSFEATARAAVDVARARGAKSATLVVKPVSRNKNLNAIFTEAITKAFDKAGIVLETKTTQEVMNTLVMNPESLGVLVANDVPSSDILESVVGGLSGGTGLGFTAYSGSSLRGFIGAGSNVNPAGTLFATAAALNATGQTAEAKKLNEVLVNALQTAGSRTIDLDGGKLDAAAFAKQL